MRLRVETADACAYPDVVVLCDKPAFHDGRKDVLTDATLVAEVLSPSTEGYDRGGKFALYRGLPGLRQYLLIAQDRLAIDVFTRQPDGRWVLDAYTDPEAVIPCDVHRLHPDPGRGLRQGRIRARAHPDRCEPGALTARPRHPCRNRP